MSSIPLPARRKRNRRAHTAYTVAASAANGAPVSSAAAIPAAPPEGRSEVLGQALFSQLLVRERKRSERSNRPFLVLSVKSKDGRPLLSSPAGKAIVDALVAGTRATDIVGWVTWPAVIGVIFLEIGSAGTTRAIETVRRRLRRELKRQPDAGALRKFAFDFHVYPGSTGGNSAAGSGSVDLIFYPDLLQQRRRGRLSDWIKRALDVVASVALLVLLSPVLLSVAILVWFSSPGPILFRQLRLGSMRKPFRMLKFRTMYVGVGEHPHYEFVSRFIKDGGRAHEGANPPLFKLANDPRITPVGRILRKTSIDELPQLWNVLIGEMSLVGPRPPLPYEVDQYAPWHHRRLLEARPGITGLWQVVGRSRTTFDEMVRLDLQYARTRSLWADLRILLRTPVAVVSGKGAC